jgi:hypothetical protein
MHIRRGGRRCAQKITLNTYVYLRDLREINTVDARIETINNLSFHYLQSFLSGKPTLHL